MYRLSHRTRRNETIALYCSNHFVGGGLHTLSPDNRSDDRPREKLDQVSRFQNVSLIPWSTLNVKSLPQHRNLLKCRDAVLFGVIKENVEVTRRIAEQSQEQCNLPTMMNTVIGCVLKQFAHWH